MTKPNSSLTEPAVKQLVVFNSGAGYTEVPNVSAIGGGGANCIIKAGINTDTLGVVEFTIEEQGNGYPEDAAIIVYDSDNNIVAEGLALTDGEKIVSAIVKDPGENLPEDVTVVVAAPASSGQGTYQ